MALGIQNEQLLHVLVQSVADRLNARELPLLKSLSILPHLAEVRSPAAVRRAGCADAGQACLCFQALRSALFGAGCPCVTDSQAGYMATLTDRLSPTCAPHGDSTSR